MSSLEEERLLQMVHDFIESEPTSNLSSSSSSSIQNNHALFGYYSTRCFTLKNFLRKMTENERRVMERVRRHMKNKMDMEKTTRLKQWLAKCLQLDGFNACLCHSSCVTSGCPCGSYDYIEIVEQGARLIVDIDFKSQFEVARATESYKELSSKLPSMFVGGEDKLNTIISLLCPAAEESLRASGLHVPPWRRPTYMQSKWRLSNCPNNNHCPESGPGPKGTVPPRFGLWAPPAGVVKGKKKVRDANSAAAGGSPGLSNQFSHMGINCC